MTKKKRALVLGGTTNHSFAMGTLLINLKETNPNLFDEVVIFHDGIGKNDQIVMNKIFSSRFFNYSFPIKDTSIFNLNTLNHFSKMVFCKFECLRLLNDYSSVLWLDYDIIVLKDLTPLFSSCESGIRMMPSSENNTVRKQLHNSIEEYDMNAIGICGSTFVLFDHLENYQDMYEFCYRSLAKYAKYLLLGEQAIFDFMIQKFNLSICRINNDTYSPHPSEIDKISDAKIMHAYGGPKFWNGLDNEIWNKNYLKWIHLGGSRAKEFSYTRTIEKIKNMVDAVVRDPYLILCRIKKIYKFY